jgi:hypothetical protein
LLRDVREHNRAKHGIGWKALLFSFMPLCIVRLAGLQDSNMLLGAAVVIAVVGFLTKVILDALWVYDEAKREKKGKT